MEATFRLKSSELTTDFIATIRRLYKKKTLFIKVNNADEMDETEYLLSSEANRKMLMESLENVRQGKLIKVDIDQYLKK